MRHLSLSLSLQPALQPFSQGLPGSMCRVRAAIEYGQYEGVFPPTESPDHGDGHKLFVGRDLTDLAAAQAKPSH